MWWLVQAGSVVRVIIKHLSTLFHSTCPWVLGSGRTLSSAYVLPSAKKAFSSARAIVSFFSAPLRPMLPALANLYQLLPKPVLIISPQAMFKNFLDLAFAPKKTSIVLAMFNQDLAGLFISIDTPRFLEGCAMLLKFLSSQMSAGTGEFFSFRPTEANNPGGLIKGRIFRRVNVTRKLRVGDVPDLLWRPTGANLYRDPLWAHHSS